MSSSRYFFLFIGCEVCSGCSRGGTAVILQAGVETPQGRRWRRQLRLHRRVVSKASGD